MTWRAQGLRAWLVQRITALYLGVFVIVALSAWLLAPPGDYDSWRGLLARPVVNVAVLLFAFAWLLHAWVGMRDIVVDYVRPFGARLAVLGLVALALVLMGLWVMSVLLSVVVV